MPQTWKTASVFVSSTFRDMHAERDHLIELEEIIACQQNHSHYPSKL